MRSSVTVLTCAASMLLGASAAAGDGDGWQTVAEGRVHIKVRAQPGANVHEVLAEADLNAPARDVVEAVVNADRFHDFMPYTKESRFVGPEKDGTRLSYMRIAAPVIADRDFFIVVRVVRALNDDGTGEFANEWRAVTSYPRRSNIVRVTTNSGSWRVAFLAPGKCHVVYRFVVDPGGGLPQWLADLGNRSGVPGIFAAVEKEARRLEAARTAHSARLVENVP